MRISQSEPATILPPALSAAMVVDAHKNDGKRYIVHSDELLSAFLELQATLCNTARFWSTKDLGLATIGRIEHLDWAETFFAPGSALTQIQIRR
jgi:hypothetical protein